DWWYHHPHSKNHLMRRFARAGNRVLFVNSISMGLPSVASPDFKAKIKRKLRSYARFVRRADDGVIVVSPAVIPFYANPLVRNVNRWLLLLQIRLLMVAYDLRSPILWIAIPTAMGVVGRLGERVLVYQVSDKYEANEMDHATGGGVIAGMHRELLERAAVVYYSGRKLFEEEQASYSSYRPKLKLLEQAVDFDHFAAATASNGLHVPDDIRGIPGPRLGYFGAIETWLLDQELIGYVARKRPDWHWVLMGLKTSRLRIEDLPNVHYLGSKQYAELPGYAAQFDACVLPWVTDNDFVSHGSPIKVREYLATGKPVVITPLYEYERLDGILRIARGYDDFIAKVEDALVRDSEIQKQARQQSIRDATWDKRAEEVSRELTLLLGAQLLGTITRPEP
ncbi:MAG TPA: glycosyltransferase, partial [Blastocatellia bacterium]|nr:glycosyltransferase [Blastocatellia bacterium]